jgi:hypothetical protein
MILYTHRITLKHNMGIKRITVTGTSKKVNIRQVLIAENCPMCAIINIKLIKAETLLFNCNWMDD